MESWKKTSCVCCAQNCGLEVLIEDNRIVRVRPDKDNPRSEGYVCRKGLKIAHYEHHADRLRTPLKRVGSEFHEVSWNDALDEIAQRLRATVEKFGPKSFAYMGGGGQGCHFEAAFAVRLLRGLGSQYHYSPLAQELTGMFWVNGRAYGKQYLWTIPDEHRTDMLISVGWNGWMSHQMCQARRHLKRISDDPEKLLVVIDPRRSETAEKADIHIALKPGTDALLSKAMIAMILDENLHDADYVSAHVSGFDEIRSWFADFDVPGALRVCEVDEAAVRDLVRLMAERKWSYHTDLGILMNRHSTLVSYLWVILSALNGRTCVSGGNVLPGTLMPMGSHSDERDARTWRTVATDFPAIMGTFPPNVLPEEIMSDHAERTRAVIVSASNPLRSYADTTAYEQAFSQLDLLVTIDVAMTETAAVSHFVLPALSAYEKWDATFFAWTFPGVFFQLRRPVVEPVGEPLEESEIHVRLAQRLGMLPEIPQSLIDAGQGDRMQYGAALMQYAASEPKAKAVLPFIVAKTLGPALGSNNVAALWGLLQTAPKDFRENAARVGFDPGPMMGEEIFRRLLERPEGLWIGTCDPDDNFPQLKTEDGTISLVIPELRDWLEEIEPAGEADMLKPDPNYPFLLSAGRHFDYNANTIMRDPAWNDGKRACTMLVHPDDASIIGLSDGGTARVTTEAGEVLVEVEITDKTRPGFVFIPHGFGLIHEGKSYGVNVNRLTKNTSRDRLAATPYHRYVPCRIEAFEQDGG